MFLNLKKDWPLYLPVVASNITDTVNNIPHLQTPSRKTAGNLAGVSLVAQYLENILYRISKHVSISDASLKAIFEKAIQLDNEMSDDIPETSDEFPTMHNCMQAMIDLGYLKNCTVQHIKPEVQAVKYFIRQYNGILVQLKTTTTTYDADDCIISDVGTVLTEDFNKGFIAHSYDSFKIVLQNSRGISCGSLGYNIMTWTTFQSLVLDAAVFDVWADRKNNVMI